ncbi:MAG: acetyl-CoA hydrolase/transferase family protein [Acidimicrobiales bacterium]
MTTPDQARRRVAAGSRVVATPGCSTPETLLAALGRRSAEAAGITLSAGLLLGAQPFAEAVRAGHLAFRSWHVTGPGRGLVEDGLAAYVPMRNGDVPAWLAGTVDVLLLRISPPDNDGYTSFGPSGSFTRAALEDAALVVAEIDERLPRTRGETLMHTSQIDELVDADTPTCEYHSAPPSEAATRIAATVVELIPRRATVQLGVGAVPEAVTLMLGQADLGRLRMVGMGSDHTVRLFDTGTLSPDDVYPEAAVLGVELLGSRVLLDHAHDNPAMAVVSSSTCHNPLWLAGRARLVSINSAVQVDLSGQVAAEAVGGRTLAGIGGSADFFEGAHHSAGGLRVVALESQTAAGASKIVADLAPGTPVSIPRHSVDVVVTEHGVAPLAGRSLTERADALIAIAAPHHRQALEQARGRN